MKIRLTMMLLMVSISVLGQVELDYIPYEILNFKKLTQFDSIVVDNKVGKVRHVYVYANGVLKRTKYFNEGRLSSYTNYSFSGNENSERVYSISTIYSSNDKPIKSWDGSYYATIEKLENNRVIERALYRSNGVDSTMNERSFLTYDSQGILINERIFKYSEAYTNVFKGNSSELDLANMMKVAKERTKKYIYNDAKLSIEYVIENQVKGKEVIEFDNKGKPTRDLSLDSDNKKLGETIITYNNEGNIIERRWAWYIYQSLWGNTGGMVELDGKETAFYNSQGLPEKVIKIYKGQKAETSIYTYY